MATKPVIGVLLGDAAGVGPELVAKCAAANFYEEYCRPVITETCVCSNVHESNRRRG